MIVLLAIMGLLALMVLGWLWQVSKLFAYLRQNHPAEYEAMGRPAVISNNTPKNNIAFLRFIMGTRPFELGDPRLENWCRFLSHFFYLYLALFLASIALIAVVSNAV